MTLNQLKYALALQKHGSFKKTAEKLSLSQPGLSLQIQKLEDDIGLILFDRSSSPVKVTSDGAVFLMRAEEIVVSANDLRQFTTRHRNDYSGRIVLGAIPTLAPFLIPLFAEDLQQDHHGLKLDIHEMTTELVIGGVRNGELDAGLISTPVNLFGIETIPLFYEKFYIYSPGTNEKKTEIRLKDINYKKLWLLNEGNCFRDQVNNFCDLKEIRKDKDFVYRSNSIDALVRIVDSKGGMTILPELTTLSLALDQEQNISPIPGKAREIGLILRKNYDKQRFILKLEEYIKKSIPKKMLSSQGMEIVDPGIRNR